jgi:glycosyltransferase involved in cell wall biosynthesis
LQKKYGKNKKIIRTGYLSDVELAAVKSMATIYCQPSYYEGFGLPVLEAMEAGIPVLAAKTQALVEIAENAAIFADPKSSDAFAEEISELINDKKLRKQLVKKGRSHVKKFSWEKAANQTLASYKKALQSNES